VMVGKGAPGGLPREEHRRSTTGMICKS